MKKRPFHFPVEEGFSELSRCGQTLKMDQMGVNCVDQTQSHLLPQELISTSLKDKLIICVCLTNETQIKLYEPSYRHPQAKFLFLCYYFVEWGVPKISSFFFLGKHDEDKIFIAGGWAKIFLLKLDHVCFPCFRHKFMSQSTWRVLIRVFLVWGFYIFVEFSS